MTQITKTTFSSVMQCSRSVRLMIYSQKNKTSEKKECKGIENISLKSNLKVALYFVAFISSTQFFFLCVFILGMYVFFFQFVNLTLTKTKSEEKRRKRSLNFASIIIFFDLAKFLRRSLTPRQNKNNNGNCNSQYIIYKI